MRLNLVTGKGLLSAGGEYGATGGFVPEMVALSTMVDEFVLHAPVAPCRSLDGADVFPRSITVRPLAQALRKWRQVFTVPFSVMRLFTRLRRGDAVICYVPSTHPIGAMGVLVCHVKGIPRVVCVRGSLLQTVQCGTLPRLKSLLMAREQRLLNWIVRRCQRGRWTFMSARSDELCEWGYRGIEPSVFDPVLPNLPCPDKKEDRTILFVGRIERAKGAHDLIAAVCGLAEDIRGSFRVWMVGKECDDGACRQLAAASGLGGQVTFFGPLPYGERLFKLYGAAKYFVLPSYSEAFGKTAVEAMAAGCVVIVSGAVPCVSNGSNGVVVPVGNPIELAGALSGLEEQPEFRDQLVLNGLQYASRYREGSPFKQIVDLAVGLARCAP